MTKQSSIEIQNTMAVLQTEYGNDRDLINQLLGQIQMADAFTKFSATVAITKLAFIKENKLFHSLSGKENGDGRQFSGTWEEFCELIGRSRRSVDEDIQNLNNFGEEALESMTRMGIGYRELRQFRKLPEDQKTALIEAAKTEDKDSLLELAEELIAKHTKEKEVLQKELAQTAEELEASRALMADKERNHDKTFYEKERLREQLEKRIKTETPDESGEALRTETNQIAYSAEVVLRGTLVNAFEALEEHTQQTGITHSEFMSGVLGQLQHALNQLRGQFDVKDEPNGETVDLSWLEGDKNA